MGTNHKSDIFKELQEFNKYNFDWMPRFINNTHELNTPIRIWRNVEVVPFKLHWHSSIEIILPVENWYDAIVAGKKYRIQPDEILIIPPRELHELIAPTEGVRFVFLFDISMLSQLKGFSGIQSMLSSPIHLTPKTHPLLYDDVNQALFSICKAYSSGEPHSELTIFSLLINMLITLSKNHIESTDLFQSVQSNKQQEYVEKFSNLLEYIDSHYTEDLTLESIAEAIGFSKYHFARLFKQYTNFTFCDYLRYRRIKAAEALLEQPEYSITDIALQSGFSSISTFNRLFKEIKSCTPTEYRNMISKRPDYREPS